MTRALMSIPEAAAALGVSSATGYRMAAADQLPIIRLGGAGDMRVIRSRLLEEYGITDDPAAA